MKKPLIILISLVIVAGLGVGAWVVFGKKAPKEPAAEQPVAYVDITAEGFSPQTLHVEKGTKVVWMNRDAAPHQVASDPYPDRSALPELFSKQPLAAEATYSFTFNKTGTWAYHDYLHPTMTAVIQVK